MSKKEFIIKLIKLIKPEFYNKVTWVVVVSGLALIGTPFLEEIIRIILNKEYDLDLAPGGNASWGFGLVVLGLGYHFATNSFARHLEYRESSIKENRAIEHDFSIFKSSQDVWPEKTQKYFLDELLDDHSCWTKSTIRPQKYIEYHRFQENQYLNQELQDAANKVISDLDKSMDWLALSFWVFPKDQRSGEDGSRICMYPHWNIDREGLDPNDMSKYTEASNELSRLVRTYRDSYATYRKLIKNKLFI